MISIVRKASTILSVPEHVIEREFILSSSGKHYAMPICKSKSFVHSAVQPPKSYPQINCRFFVCAVCDIVGVPKVVKLHVFVFCSDAYLS